MAKFLAAEEGRERLVGNGTRRVGVRYQDCFDPKKDYVGATSKADFVSQLGGQHYQCWKRCTGNKFWVASRQSH